MANNLLNRMKNGSSSLFFAYLIILGDMLSGPGILRIFILWIARLLPLHLGVTLVFITRRRPPIIFSVNVIFDVVMHMKKKRGPLLILAVRRCSYNTPV